MKPINTLIIVIALSASIGCSMCCGPYDYDYPVYGGRHERVDRTYGRVGSVFSDPLADLTGPSADSNLKGPESNGKDKPGSGKSNGSGADSDADIEQFRKELESISPKKKPKSPSRDELKLENLEELPQPNGSQDPTAQQPHRSQWQWR